MNKLESHASFGGRQEVFEHHSETLGCAMKVGVYLPPQALAGEDCPTLTFLSGLTCSEQNVITKGGAQRACAEHGIILVAPDTSPRGADVADAPDWDLGQGAGFYLTATQAPWSAHYRMDQYIVHELPSLIQKFTKSVYHGITGHSMGGHGALVLALRHPGVFRSVSALAPILQPCDVPWGHKAFSAYLGEDRDTWAQWDAAHLIKGARERLPLLIDQGDADPFLESQLHSARFKAACAEADHPLRYRLHPGYDHGYYFVSSVIADHVAHHAAALRS